MGMQLVADLSLSKEMIVEVQVYFGEHDAVESPENILIHFIICSRNKGRVKNMNNTKKKKKDQ